MIRDKSNLVIHDEEKKIISPCFWEIKVCINLLEVKTILSTKNV